MKKLYELPQMELTVVSYEDVITTSDNDNIAEDQFAPKQ